MSYGNAYCSLYAACDTKEQAEALYHKFHQDNPTECEFEADYHVSCPLKVNFDLTSHEVSRSFDTNVRLLDRWIKSNFAQRLRGHWLLECDDGNYKYEIHRGEISNVQLEWLKSHSVEEINLIRQWAQIHFSHPSPYIPKTPFLMNCNLPASRINDGYVHAALQVSADNKEQAGKICALYEQLNPSWKIFQIRQEASSPNKIIFRLKNQERTEPIDEQVIQLARWINRNFSLELSGAWYHDSAEQTYRNEIHHGEIIISSLDWLLDYTIEEIDQIRLWARDQYPHPKEVTESSTKPPRLPYSNETSRGESFQDAYVSLSVYCSSSTQQKDVCRKCKSENPGYGNFTMECSDDFPFEIMFRNNDKHASSSLERSIMHLHRWLKKNFDLQLEGFWLQYYPEIFRGEICYGEISRRNLSWLIEYSNAEIQEISNWARKRFYPPEEE